MPETVIGYAPDVGATHYLSLLDGKIGRYLALTGATIKGREVLSLGLATHYVPSHSIDALVARLEAVEDIDQQGGIHGLVSIIQDYEVRYEDSATRKAKGSGLDRWRADEPDSPSRFVGPVRRVLDLAFSASSVDGIKKVLREYSSVPASALADVEDQAVAEFAAETLATLETRSPVSLAVTLRGMIKAEEEDLKSVAAGRGAAACATPFPLPSDARCHSPSSTRRSLDRSGEDGACSCSWSRGRSLREGGREKEGDTGGVNDGQEREGSVR